MTDKLIATVPLDPAQCVAMMGRWAHRLPEPDENGCINWPGFVGPTGHGRIENKQAHRVAFVAATGQDIPRGLVIDHLCRNPSCVNTTHLRVVSQRVNVLAGETVPADHAQRTHCPKGHPLKPGNLVAAIVRRGGRSCAICQKQREDERNAAIGEARRALGLTHRQYIAIHGWSLATAERLIKESA